MIFNNSISSIVGDLEKKVAKLTRLAAKHDSNAEAHQLIAKAATELSEGHKAESARALRIAEKVKAILD